MKEKIVLWVQTVYICINSIYMFFEHVLLVEILSPSYSLTFLIVFAVIDSIAIIIMLYMGKIFVGQAIFFIRSKRIQLRYRGRKMNLFHYLFISLMFFIYTISVFMRILSEVFQISSYFLRENSKFFKVASKEDEIYETIILPLSNFLLSFVFLYIFNMMSERNVLKQLIKKNPVNSQSQESY